jgi:hypothetical protein
MKPQFTEGTDITARLTTWCHAPQSDSAQDLMDEAAKEIERLRNGAVSGRETVHLSERDRDLLRFAANTIGDADCAALFRRLLKDLP